MFLLLYGGWRYIAPLALSVWLCHDTTAVQLFCHTFDLMQTPSANILFLPLFGFLKKLFYLYFAFLVLSKCLIGFPPLAPYCGNSLHTAADLPPDLPF